jgi:predicted metalloprotease with PDZ domain
MRAQFLFAICLELGICAAASAIDAEYVVTIDDPRDRRVHVQMTLRNAPAGATGVDLHLPRAFAFVRLDEPLIKGPDGATVGRLRAPVERASPYRWRVPVAGSADVELSYEIPMRHRLLPEVAHRDSYEYPYIADDHAMLATATMMLIPDGLERATVRFVMPEGWSCVAPWPGGDEGVYQPADVASLRNDYIVAGDWSISEAALGDGAFRAIVAIAPDQDALRTMAVEPIASIVREEARIFGVELRGTYMFVFGRPEISGSAGSPKTNSMTLAISESALQGGLGYLGHLIAHEFFHTWEAAVYDPRDEMRWHTEGFTDYYANLVSARLGLITWEAFGETIAGAMTAIDASPLLGETTLAEAGGPAFFTDRDAYELVYKGGMVSAAWLDLAMRSRTDATLEDLSRALVNDPDRRDDPPTVDLFVSLVGEMAGARAASTMRSLVAEPYEPNFGALFATVGLDVAASSEPDLSLRANLDDDTIRDIDRACAAYALGLRPGDRVLRVNGRDVEDPRMIRTYWAQPENDRLSALIERDGQQIEIDAPVPLVKRYTLPIETWTRSGG